VIDATQTVQTSNVAVHAVSDTTFTSGTVVHSGSNMITARSAAQGIRYDFNSAVRQVTIAGNTAGAGAAISSGTMQLAGGNGVTLSQDANTITISGGGGGGAGDLLPKGNTTGTTASIEMSTNWALAGGNNITLSGHSDSATNLTISAPNTTSETNYNLAFWEPFPPQQASRWGLAPTYSKTPFYFPVTIPGNLTLNSVGVRLSVVTGNTIASFSQHFGVYTLVNSTSAALAGSASNAYVVSSASSVSLSSVRDWYLTSPSTVPGMSVLTPGNYIFGMMWSATASNAMNFSIIGQMSSANSSNYVPWGVIGPGTNALTTATSAGVNRFLGQGSTTVDAMPANVIAAEIRNQATASPALAPYIFIRS
jgi:hypothetical protein